MVTVVVVAAAAACFGAIFIARDQPCASEGKLVWVVRRRPFELELELIQPPMAHKPVLRGEVGCACVAPF